MVERYLGMLKALKEKQLDKYVLMIKLMGNKEKEKWHMRDPYSIKGPLTIFITLNSESGLSTSMGVYYSM